MRASVVITSLLVIATFLGCDLLVNRDDKLPDFGMEEGYFYWIWDPGSETKEQATKIELKLDRNHLSIRFYEEYGKAHHDSVLEAYGIETVWSQTFGKTYPMSGRYRVTKKPAEDYYTSFGVSVSDRFGDLPEVEYALPAFYLNDRFWDIRLTPIILYTFHDHITEKRQEEILDSLEIADGVRRYKTIPDDPWSLETIYVTKDSRADPYSLYHDYHQLPFFKIVSMNLAQTTIRYRTP
jgi:hypothetical protein